MKKGRMTSGKRKKGCPPGIPPMDTGMVDSLHNNQFHDLYRRYLNRIIRTAEITLEQEGRKEEVLKEHQSIIDAIKAGDQPASHKAVLKHLMVTRQLNQDALANLQEQRADSSSPAL